MRRAGLQRRLTKLQPKPPRQFTPPRMVMALYDHSGDEIGYSSGSGSTVMRQPFEPLEQLTARAFSELGATTLFAVYPNVGIEAPPAPTPIANPPQSAPDDPFALAGIGKTDARYAKYSSERWPNN